MYFDKETVEKIIKYVSLLSPSPTRTVILYLTDDWVELKNKEKNLLDELCLRSKEQVELFDRHIELLKSLEDLCQRKIKMTRRQKQTDRLGLLGVFFIIFVLPWVCK